MTKPVCVKCHQFFKPKKTGMGVIEGMPIGNAVPPGLSHDSLWRDYKLWVADLYECAGCGTQIFVGFGREPVSEHYKPDFQGWKQRFGANYRINDC